MCASGRFEVNFPFVIARSNEVATWQSGVAKCGFALIPTLTLGMTYRIFKYSITQTKFGYHRAKMHDIITK